MNITMKDLFSSLPVVRQHVSTGFVHALIQRHRQELFTGVMVTKYPSGEMFTSVFCEGDHLGLFQCLEETNLNIPRKNWLVELDRADANASLLPLPVEGLRVFQLFLESVPDSAERSSFSSFELPGQLKRWSSLREGSLVWISSNQFASIISIAGFGNSTLECVDILDGSAHFFRRNLNSRISFPDGEYKVVRYICSYKQDVWRENGLRLAFNPLIQALIARFQELAGRILAERLCNQLSGWCAGRGWNISIGSNIVTNRQFFVSLEQAVRVYHGIIRRFQEESTLAIGPRLAENLLLEGLAKVETHQRKLLVEHLYSQDALGDTLVDSRKEITES